MTVTRTYHSPARQARRQHTKQAIIDAFIAQLGDPGRAALSPAAAARAAGVSIRTVHHYFPDADAQLAAVAAEVEARLFPQPPPLPQTPAELPDLVTAVYHGSEGQLPLLRALVTQQHRTTDPGPPAGQPAGGNQERARGQSAPGRPKPAAPSRSCPCSPAPTPG